MLLPLDAALAAWPAVLVMKARRGPVLGPGDTLEIYSRSNRQLPGFSASDDREDTDDQATRLERPYR